MAAEKKVVDWEVIEREYRAGLLTLRQIAEGRGVSHVSIANRAKKEGWVRDLAEKIQKAAEEKVNKVVEAEINRSINKQDPVKKATEKAIVEANAEVLAQADLLNRQDVVQGINVSRSHLTELDALGDPRFKALLEAVANEYDQSTDKFTDKANELYRYVISLSGRIKMAKDVAGSLGVYIPMQRKILKLDAEANRNQSEVDDVLKRILNSG